MNYALTIARAAIAAGLAANLAACSAGSSPATPIQLPVTTQSNANATTQSSAVTTEAKALATTDGIASLHGRPCGDDRRCIKRVLMVSIDGLHMVDLKRFVANHPKSALASLSHTGLTYSDAHTAVPSDSFPGLLALATGGHPKSTGVYYEVSYDRTLYPPKSNCSGTPGTTVAFDESIDYNPNDINAGGGINPATLTLSKAAGCTPVYPHNYLRVNTLFEVIKAAGGHTAWSDKEHSYDILNGPSGHGVDDLYDLEIAAGGTTGSEIATQQYDDLKVKAIMNEIDGKSSTGAPNVGVPEIFGMNFQAVSVGQKLAMEPSDGTPLAGLKGGYLDATGTPGPLLESGLEHTDASIASWLAELAKNGLMQSTLVVITAKHGQTPIDITKRRGIAGAAGTIGTALANNSVGFVQTDDLALIWLTDRSEANEKSAYANLTPLATALGFTSGKIYSESDRPVGFAGGNDPRTPDFSIAPDPGVIYTGGTKIAEHGGFNDDDTHVGLLVSAPNIEPRTFDDHVETTQVAPTILRALGIDPDRLQAVAYEGTRVLPGFGDRDGR